MSGNYEAVVWNDVLGDATASMLEGRPDCFDTIEDGLTFAGAIAVAVNHPGNCAVRRTGDQKQILRGPSELIFANNMAIKTGMDDKQLLSKFNTIFYGGMNDEYWDYV